MKSLGEIIRDNDRATERELREELGLPDDTGNPEKDAARKLWFRRKGISRLKYWSKKGAA